MDTEHDFQQAWLDLSESDRLQGIGYAWLGWTKASRLLVVIFMVFGALLLFFVFMLVGAPGGSDIGLIVNFLIISAGLFWAGVALEQSCRKSDSRKAEVQKVATGWLENNYPTVVAAIQSAVKTKILASVGCAQPLDFELVTLPMPNLLVVGGGAVPPSFVAPQAAGIVRAIVRSGRSLILLPPTAAVLKESGIGASLRQAFKTPTTVATLDYRSAVIAFAKDGARAADGQAAISKLTGLTSIELFYSEMINIETELGSGPTSDESQRVEVTMRDGRRLGFSAQATLISTTVEAVRSTKGQNPSNPPAPDSESASGSKVCPMCAEPIRAAARICRFCRYDFSSEKT